MTERERLIELLKTVADMRIMRCGFSECADYLLANGVIVPPCKVGDTVYAVDYTRFGGTIFECKIAEIASYCYGTFYYLNRGLHTPRFHACKEDSFGKTVFLTKEEAEKALAERSRQ